MKAVEERIFPERDNEVEGSRVRWMSFGVYFHRLRTEVGKELEKKICFVDAFVDLKILRRSLNTIPKMRWREDP